MDKREIKISIADGYILARVTFELLGSPKAHVEKAIKSYLDNLKKDHRIKFVKEELGEIEQTKGKLWSTFAEVEMLIKNLETLTWLCINFMPASIEILEPAELVFKGRELQNWLNDLLAKLHETNTNFLKLKSQHEGMVRGMNTLILNSIMIGLDKPKTEEDIGKTIGISHTQLKPFIEALIKEKKLIKTDNLYSKPK
ncbi:MAG: hypothetical protein ABIE94_06570 [archaeon]